MQYPRFLGQRCPNLEHGFFDSHFRILKTSLLLFYSKLFVSRFSCGGARDQVRPRSPAEMNSDIMMPLTSLLSPETDRCIGDSLRSTQMPRSFSPASYLCTELTFVQLVATRYYEQRVCVICSLASTLISIYSDSIFIPTQIVLYEPPRVGWLVKVICSAGGFVAA